MLGYIFLLLILVFSFKYFRKIEQSKTVFFKYEVSRLQFNSLKLSLLFNIMCILCFVFLSANIGQIGLVALTITLVLPGILMARRLSINLETSGVTEGKEAATLASNISWLGVAAGLFVISNVVLGALLQSY